MMEPSAESIDTFEQKQNEEKKKTFIEIDKLNFKGKTKEI